MRPRTSLLVALLVGAALAGCTRPQESAEDPVQRAFLVDVPPNATEVRVDATAYARGLDLTLLVEDDHTTARIGERTWRADGTADANLTVNVTGVDRLRIVAMVEGGSAVVGLLVTAIVPEGEDVLLLEQQAELTPPPQRAEARPTPTTPASPTPASPTPSPTPAG